MSKQEKAKELGIDVWLLEPFTNPELVIIRATWNKLASESKVVYGPKAPIIKNMLAMINLLMKENKGWPMDAKQGFFPNTSKYKGLHAFVSRKSKAFTDDS